MFSGLFGGGGSAKRAAQVAAAKQAEAGGVIKGQFEETAATYQPYMQAGTGALSEYQRLAGGLEAPTQEMRDVALTMDPIVEQIRTGDYTATPGYEFRREEGRRALEQSAAAKGGLFSGATGRELERYGQGVATSEYDNYLNRLRGQLGDVQTQMGGRQSALNAAYQNLGAYSPLIQTGYGATAGLGALGERAAQQRAGYIAGEGATYASGMQAKDAQMKAAGDQWLQMGATAVGGALGGPAGASMGSSMFGGGGAQTQAMPWANPDNIQMGATDPSLPWLQQGGAQQQAALRTASSFA